MGLDYTRDINLILHKQVEKGLETYGVTLENTSDLTDPAKILDAMLEEGADLMMYGAHLKRYMGLALQQERIAGFTEGYKAGKEDTLKRLRNRFEDDGR